MSTTVGWAAAGVSSDGGAGAGRDRTEDGYVNNKKKLCRSFDRVRTEAVRVSETNGWWK